MLLGVLFLGNGSHQRAADQGTELAAKDEALKVVVRPCQAPSSDPDELYPAWRM